jgi:CarboxypepD_reg-like domain
MKKMQWLLLFLCLISSSAFSQQTIKGKVITSLNAVPVPGCSVFISNTSKGTVTDKNGYFELYDIPAGKHELVVSSIGYQTAVYPFSAEQLPLQVKFEVDVKVKELQNVTVEPFTEEGWNKWGKLFTDNFIGSTPNAKHCKIKNENAIRFRYYKKSKRVIAYADEPIVLENSALGYRISYQLEEFEVNFNTRVALFSGYPLFENMNAKRKGQPDKWKHNRDNAYYGSIMHFMRSLYAGSLAQQGFEVRRMVKIPNREKERVKKIYRPVRLMGTSRTTGVTVITKQSSQLINLPPDSLEYYERILEQDDYKEVYGQNLLTADSLIIRAEGAYKILFFTDYLYITYDNEMEEPAYLLFHGEKRKPAFQHSYLTMPNLNLVNIDENGSYSPPQEILTSAYWGWSEKMADFLPVDYKPSGD